MKAYLPKRTMRFKITKWLEQNDTLIALLMLLATTVAFYHFY